MNKLLFYFDFHGVLERDNELAVMDKFNRIMRKFKIDFIIDLKTTIKHYGKSWRGYFKDVAGVTDKNLLNEMNKIVSSSIDFGKRTFIKPQYHVHKVLNEIKEKGHDIIIVSGTSPDRLDDFVERIGVGHYITERIGVDRHENKDVDLLEAKVNSVLDYIEDRIFEGVDYDGLIVIGDNEDFDIKAGKKISKKSCLEVITCLFVDKQLNLFNTEKEKEEYFLSIKTKADHKIRDLRVILKMPELKGYF